MGFEVVKKRMEELFFTVKDRRDKVLLKFSGGKDSSYVLYLLKRVYKLDNISSCSVVFPISSDLSLKNIRLINKMFGSDPLEFKVGIDFYKKFMSKGLIEGYKLDMGPSVACTFCSYIKDVVCLNKAIENNAKVILCGWDKSQSSDPVFFGGRNAIKYLEKQYGKVYGIFRDHFPEYRNTVYDMRLEELDSDHIPAFVSPLTFIDYTHGDIYKGLEELGLDRKDLFNSETNCDALEFFNYLSYSYYNSHSNMVSISRELRQNGSLTLNNYKISRKEFGEFLQEHKRLLQYCYKKQASLKECQGIAPTILKILGQDRFSNLVERMKRIEYYFNYFGIR